MKQLKNNVYGVLTLGGFINGYVIDHPDGLVVVDTGLGSGFIRQLVVGLSEINRTLDECSAHFADPLSSRSCGRTG